MAKQKSEVASALKKASEGLTFQSETDAPFEVVEWPGEQGKPDKARVLELAGVPAGTAVKVKGIDSFFKDSTAQEDWQEDEERAEVQRFKQLVQALKDTLTDAKVFVVGKPESDAYVVGRTDSGWAGLKTKVVQT
jgi:histidine triad (HIT) family protein